MNMLKALKNQFLEKCFKEYVDLDNVTLEDFQCESFVDLYEKMKQQQHNHSYKGLLDLSKLFFANVNQKDNAFLQEKVLPLLNHTINLIEVKYNSLCDDFVKQF